MPDDDIHLAGLPFDALIAAPLISAAKASAALAQTTSDFISAVGNAPPLTFSFTRHREVPDALGGGSQVVAEDVALSLPVLGAVSVPNLQITTMTVSFDLEVRSFGTSDTGTATPELHGMPSAHREQTRTSDSFAKYTFDINAVDGGMPEGLARVLDLFAQSVAPMVSSSAPVPPPRVDDGLEGKKMDQLRLMIEEINAMSGSGERLSRGGSKADLVARIRAARAAAQ